VGEGEGIRSGIEDLLTDGCGYVVCGGDYDEGFKGIGYDRVRYVE